MVATSFSGRDISCKEWKSRHHLAVAISDPRDAKDKSRRNKSFRDIKRAHKHNIEVATSKEPQYRKAKSRCHSVVATSMTRKEGRDVIERSRHQIQGVLKANCDQIEASATNEQKNEVATYD